MCAIAGILGESAPNGKIKVDRMLASMKHRGPDYSEVRRVSEDVFLGHNRLSIIDLQAGSNQPFVSNDGRFTIVFNGEIYNYRELRDQLHEYQFRTNSDTEVLLASYVKWGKGCLQRLIGMFAFAIWDNDTRTLFASRDRFGVKPFYYRCERNSLLFASEIKALWATGMQRNRNQKVWSSFFVYGSYGMPHETFWEGVSQLPGGHTLLWSNGNITISRWYRFDENVMNLQPELALASEEDLTERYFQMLVESVEFRFRADVPVGFNVSGGLDSSLLLSLINQRSPERNSINAYTFYTGHADYDELPWVRTLVGMTSFPLHAVKLNPAEVPEMAEQMAVVQDEPFGGIPTLAYASLFKEARSQNTVVLLDGQGMDEAWAGYDYYRSGTSEVIQGVKTSPLRPNVLTEEFRRCAEKPDYSRPFKDDLLNLQYRDLFYTKIPRALRFNDRVSMMYSTELREPFLDHRLVEMAFALPTRFKIHDEVGKYLLRKITRKLLPESIRLAPKRPLQTPQREWLAGELLEWADGWVRKFAASEEIDADNLKMEWNAYCRQWSDNSFYIWQFINTAMLWP